MECAGITNITICRDSTTSAEDIRKTLRWTLGCCSVHNVLRPRPQRPKPQEVRGSFTRRTFRASMRRVSHVFVGYIYDKRRFSARFIADYWAMVEPFVPGERLVQVAVSPRVEGVFYFGGKSAGKLSEFNYGCEAFLRDGYAAGPGRKQLEEGTTDFQYATWMASESAEFDVSMCFSGDSFEGRAMIREQAERIQVENGVVQHHEIVKLTQSPQELGMVIDQSLGFDEEEYQRLLTEKEDPFRPGLLVHDEIGVPRGKVMDAHAHAWSGSGTVLWPAEGPIDTPQMRLASMAMATPQLPSFPLWTDRTADGGLAMSGKITLPRRRRKEA